MQIEVSRENGFVGPVLDLEEGMMTRTVSILCFAMISSVALWSVAAPDSKTISEKRKITVAEIQAAEVIGLLGVPLGQVVVVEGVVADEDFRKLRKDVGRRLLRVQKVDGKELGEEVVFHFSPYGPVGKNHIEKPKVGEKFSFIAYEDGGFRGVPSGAKELANLEASPGYGFSTRLMLLKDKADTKE